MTPRLTYCEYELQHAGFWKCPTCGDERWAATIRACTPTNTHKVGPTPRPPAAPPPRPQFDTGRQLANIIKRLGFNREGCQRCSGMVRRMNFWGPEGCRAHRAEIVLQLRNSFAELSNAEVVAAIAKAITTGLALRLNPLDPFGSLVDEAIRRSEVNQSQG